MDDFYNKKITSVEKPQKELGIDQHDTVMEQIASGETLGQLTQLTSISYNRDRMYDLMDDMFRDTTMSSALEAYVEYSACPNDNGKTVWVDSQDADISKFVSLLLKQLDIDKQVYGWAYQLIKYGDVYVRLFRESDAEASRPNTKKSLHESTLAAYYNNHVDKYVNYVKTEANPAEMFDLKKFGKTYAFIKAPMATQTTISDAVATNQSGVGVVPYQISVDQRQKDTQIFQPTEYVHAALNQSFSRQEETLQLFTDDDAQEVYSVNRGIPLFYNLYQQWKQLKLLENAILLTRLTSSSILRVVNVETGNMSSEDKRSLVHEISQMIQSKIAMSANNSMNNYMNDSPLVKYAVMPTNNGLGAVSQSTIGEVVDVKQLYDLDYFKNRLYSGLRIPKAYLGDTSDSAGFNGGESLSQISLMFAKTVRRVQNCIIQMVTDLINLLLLDRGMTDYIDKFQIMMNFPDTSESRSRRETLSNQIQFIRDFNGLFESAKLDEVAQLEITKALLTTVVDNDEVLISIQEEIDNAIEKKKNGQTEKVNNENKENGDMPLMS